MRLDWDLIALLLAALAVALRLAEHPRASGIVSTFTILASALGASRRRRYRARRVARSEYYP